jgi:hypothetical protein
LPYGVQSPALQTVVDGHVAFFGCEHCALELQEQEAAASAFFGATNEATTGSATIDANPIFLMTSRLDCSPNADLTLLSRRSFSFNWSIASQTMSSDILPSDSA